MASSANPNSTKKVNTTNQPPTKKIRITSGNPSVTTNGAEGKKKKGKSRLEHITPTDDIKAVSRTGPITSALTKPTSALTKPTSAITKPANESKLKQQSIIAALANVTVFVWDEFALGK